MKEVRERKNGTQEGAMGIDGKGGGREYGREGGVKQGKKRGR